MPARFAVEVVSLEALALQVEEHTGWALAVAARSTCVVSRLSERFHYAGQHDYSQAGRSNSYYSYPFLYTLIAVSH